MRFYVYILFSRKIEKFYTGTTDDVRSRINEHNSAFYKDSFTSRGIPWELYLIIECATSQEAYALERFIKKMKSAVFIQKLKNQPDLIAAILKKIKDSLKTVWC